MDRLHKMFIFIAFLILSAAIDGARANTIITGSVFCDRCKDNHLTIFDYPIKGIKVTMACTNSNGEITMQKEAISNWVGSYSMKLDGSPDLSGCYAQVSGSESGSSGCGAAAGPAKTLKLTFGLFGLEMYIVDALLSQPAEPMSSCPKSSIPLPSPVNPVRSPPVPVKSPPFSVPPLPPMPPVPFLEASACPHQNWMMPQYRCYWRAVNPDMKVALVFGLLAARRYGNDMTLWVGLQGRGDPYRTLLREGTTALLNSYNSIQFQYNAISVVEDMNLALMGSERTVLLTALRFIRANSGSGKATCKLTPCK